MRVALLLLVAAVLVLLVWSLRGSGTSSDSDGMEPSPHPKEELAERAHHGPSPEGDEGLAPSLRGTVEDVRAGAVTVHVRTASGVPLESRTVEAVRGGETLAAGITNHEGVVTLSDVPWDGTASVQVKHSPFTRVLPAGYGDASAPRVRGPTLEYAVLGEVGYRLRIVDAWTGEPLACAVTLDWQARQSWITEPAPGADHQWRLVVPPGRSVSSKVGVDPPAGYVRWNHRWKPLRPAPEARLVEIVLPLPREAQVLLEDLKDEKGHPCAEPVDAWVHFGPRTYVNPETEPHGPNGWRLLGVPFFRDQPFDLRVTTWEETLRWDAKARLPSAPWIPVHVKMPVPITTWRDPSSASPPPPPPLLDRSQHDVGLELRVLRFDGRPAPGVTVIAKRKAARQMAETDEEGRARLRMPAGDIEVRARGNSFLPVRTVVKASAGETKAVELREPVGGRLHVEVAGQDGKPIRFACVELEGVSVDLVDGVQRVDPFTDVRGKRSWGRVQPGKLDYVVTWAGLRHEGTLEIADDADHDVRVVLAWE